MTNPTIVRTTDPELLAKTRGLMAEWMRTQEADLLPWPTSTKAEIVADIHEYAKRIETTRPQLAVARRDLATLKATDSELLALAREAMAQWKRDQEVASKSADPKPTAPKPANPAPESWRDRPPLL